ncbi:MAG: class II D-tagatose-bisphosphate aldolase, non-catalytic subunit, partial [Oscillospiraceae bacterium]
TANQVDQYGGYTGMKPSDFAAFVLSIAEEYQFPKEKLILGGDHLGPLTFASLSEHEAMERSKELVRQYVLAGFTKIHLDTSMRIADDSASCPLSDDIIASRAAILCRECEDAYIERLKAFPDSIAPVYVIGSEVPIPGGAQEEEDSVSITGKEDALKTINSFTEHFKKAGASSALERVIALVVQPGVEFGDGTVLEYDRKKANELCSVLCGRNLIFEAHSTDYQTKKCLREMVEDGFAILKVGPALTFALREAIFALDMIEAEMSELKGLKPTGFRDKLNNCMLSDDRNWAKHYHGDEKEKAFARAFSFSNRDRYYLTDPCIVEALNSLIANLEKYEIPLTLLSQYMPMQYTAVRNNTIKNEPKQLIKHRIRNCIDDYLFACSDAKD